MSMQDRDIEILKNVSEYGLLSLEGIRALAGFNSRERATVRTRLLFDHGYLDRRFLSTTRGSAKVLHALGAEGVELVAQRLGQEVLEVKRRRRAALDIREPALPHTLAVTEVRLALRVALDRCVEAKLDTWIPSAELSRIFQARPFLPDGHFRYRHQGKVYACFLEVDMGTESHRRIVKKAEHYLEYGLSGKYTRDFGLRFFRTLIVAPTEARRDHLQSTIERVTDKMFWLTVRSEIRPNTVLGPIWTRPRRPGAFSLLEA